jgi:hypothetical protein
MYLPKDLADPDAAFLDLNNEPQTYYDAGQWVDISARWESSIPVLAKVGSAIPVGRAEQVLSVGETSNPANLPHDDYRAVEIFPPKASSKGKEYESVWFEDDGVSPPPAKISVFTVKYETTETQVLVQYEEKLQEGFRPHWEELEIILPRGDTRSVVFNRADAVKTGVDKQGREKWKCSIESRK